MGGVISRIEEVVPAARNTGNSTAIQTQILMLFLQTSRTPLSHSSNTTGVPSRTRSATLVASQLVIRTQP